MTSHIVVPRYGRFLIKQQRENIRVSEWKKGHGKTIECGEPAVVVETSKASLELEATATGLLFHLRKAGEKCGLEEIIGVIADSREEFEALF
jgi:pyruvate/2-oxoglutarate dehydrogenase complex dihydrolipoamide acyltransferase (E2) component